MKLKSIFTAIALSCALALPANAAHIEPPESVPTNSIQARPTVVKLVQPQEDKTDLILVEDEVGFLWSFYSDHGDWQIGDGCTIILLDVNGTAEIIDDCIISAVYSRYDLLPF